MPARPPRSTRPPETLQAARSRPDRWVATARGRGGGRREQGRYPRSTRPPRSPAVRHVAGTRRSGHHQEPRSRGHPGARRQSWNSQCRSWQTNSSRTWGPWWLVRSWCTSVPKDHWKCSHSKGSLRSLSSTKLGRCSRHSRHGRPSRRSRRSRCSKRRRRSKPSRRGGHSKRSKRSRRSQRSSWHNRSTNLHTRCKKLSISKVCTS
mmetsp:Transcript_61720/g.139060  ORF Transcript_61720/g.139060 Transcript_61720/m.139060 type:complete len:206 (-) Transcript_61720:29-646(-)